MSRGVKKYNEQAVEYYTPKKLLDYLGPFDYDPATTLERALYHRIPNFTCLPDDGLLEDWTRYKRIWINPPFNDKHHFWWKACETYQKAHNRILFLCPIEFLTTARFHKPNQPITLFLPEGRIKFEREASGGGEAKSPAFGSVIIKPSDSDHIVYLPKGYIR